MADAILEIVQVFRADPSGSYERCRHADLHARHAGHHAKSPSLLSATPASSIAQDTPSIRGAINDFARESATVERSRIHGDFNGATRDCRIYGLRRNDRATGIRYFEHTDQCSLKLRRSAISRMKA